MASKKVAKFYRQESDWFSDAGLPYDVRVVIGGVNFHLHKFPLVSRCGKLEKMANIIVNTEHGVQTIILEEFPGGPDIFLLAAKFCYDIKVELTPRNVIPLICAADFLEMTEDYVEANLLPKSAMFFQKTVLSNWKNCILALQSCSFMIPICEKLDILNKCLSAISTMACSDPSLFGWPMGIFGRLQSPGGNILWNGLSTGMRIRSSDSGWWFEDVSYLNVDMFERLIWMMEAKGIRSKILAECLMFYCKKYLPGLARWHGRQGTKPRTVTNFSLTPATVVQKDLLERAVTLMPERKGRSYCRFLFGLLRFALILDASCCCLNSLQKKIGLQLEMATLDGLLIPMYSGNDTLYNTTVIERIVGHFLDFFESKETILLFSPSSVDPDASQSSDPLRTVGKLIDDYVADVASDANLKPEKFCSLAQSIPDPSRSLHDGLYRAVDIYLKEHPWLSNQEKKQLCGMIDYQKLSAYACAHASQNDRLPPRSILKAIFFQLMHLKTTLAGLQSLVGPEEGVGTQNAPIVPRDGWVAVMRTNRSLRIHMEEIRSKLVEIEKEFGEMRNLLPRLSDSQPATLQVHSSPPSSTDHAGPSRRIEH